MARSASCSTATTSDRSTRTRRSNCQLSQGITRYKSKRADTPVTDAPLTQSTPRSSTFAAAGPGSGPSTSRPSLSRTWHSRSSTSNTRCESRPLCSLGPSSVLATPSHKPPDRRWRGGDEFYARGFKRGCPCRRLRGPCTVAGSLVVRPRISPSVPAVPAEPANTTITR